MQRSCVSRVSVVQSTYGFAHSRCISTVRHDAPVASVRGENVRLSVILCTRPVGGSSSLSLIYLNDEKQHVLQGVPVKRLNSLRDKRDAEQSKMPAGQMISGAVQ